MGTRETITRSGFTFRRLPDGWEVYCRGRSIGRIIATREASGRHAFRLEWDVRRRPRCYRGMVTAANALKAIDSVKRKCKGQCAEALIIQAWEEKTRGSLR